MSVPSSRNWQAVVAQLARGKHQVRVTGEVQARSPSLLARMPQGLDPRILMLDLSRMDDGPDYENVEYRQASDAQSYDAVDIFYLGQEVSRIAIEQPRMTTGPGGGAKAQEHGGKPARKKMAKKKAVKRKTKNTAKKKTKRTAKKKSKKKSVKKASGKKRT